MFNGTPLGIDRNKTRHVRFDYARSLPQRTGMPIAHDEEDHHKALAEHYAAFWNDLEAAGLEPTDNGIWKVADELAGGNWVLHHDKEDGFWKVVHVDHAHKAIRYLREGKPLRYAVRQGHFWEDEPRDEKGEWTSGGAKGKAKKPMKDLGEHVVIDDQRAEIPAEHSEPALPEGEPGPPAMNAEELAASAEQLKQHPSYAEWVKKVRGGNGDPADSNKPADDSPEVEAAHAIYQKLSNTSDIGEIRAGFEPIRNASKTTILALGEKLGYNLKGQSKKKMADWLQQTLEMLAVSRTKRDIIASGPFSDEGKKKKPAANGMKAGDEVVIGTGEHAGRSATVIADNGEFVTIEHGKGKFAKRLYFPKKDLVPRRYAAPPLFVYRCPYCGGIAYQNSPIQGGRFVGYALCSRCGKGFSILGKTPEQRPATYAAQVKILRYQQQSLTPAGNTPPAAAAPLPPYQPPAKTPASPAAAGAAPTPAIGGGGAARIPKGYIVNKDGRIFRAGMWVSAQDLATATPAPTKGGAPGEGAAHGPVVEAQKQAAYHHEKRRSRGPVNRAALAERTTPHAHQVLAAHEHTRAKRVFAGLHQHHGDLTAHRLEELINGAHEALQHVHPDDEVTRDRLSKRLRGYHEMLDWHDKKQAARNPWEGGKPEHGGRVYWMPTDKITADPERFQYKLGVNKEGVTQELKGVKKWDPEMAGVVLVWKDPATGNTHVINGHHRLELAKRLGVKNLNAMYIDAPNDRIARARGAMVNIAEGRGTPVDAAKFMRDMGKTPEQMAQDGISLNGKLAADAVTLTKLNDRLFTRVTIGKLPVDQALTIAANVQDHDLQDLLVNRIEKEEAKGRDISPRLLNEMARKVAEAPKIKLGERGGQRGLFDDLEAEDSVFVEQCDLQAYVRAELAKEFSLWKPLSIKRREAATGEGTGNVLNIEANKQRAAEAAEASSTFDRLVNRTGLISNAFKKYAVEYAKAQTNGERNDIRQRCLADVRNAIRAEEAAGGSESLPPESGGMEAGVPGSQEGPQGAEPVPAEGAGDTGPRNPQPAGVTGSGTDGGIDTSKAIIVPPNNLGIRRAWMPQIAAKHVPEFLDNLRRQGIGVEATAIPVKDLKSTQSELSTEQMQTLLEKLPVEKLRAPVITSSDGYVLDGHHRWGALTAKDPESTIQANAVDLPIKDLLEQAKNFDKTTYKDISASGAGLPPIHKMEPLREPSGAHDLHPWLKEALDHPYIKEAEKRLADRSKDTDKKYQRPDGTWDPQRVKDVHEPIINKFLNPKAVAPAGQKPKAVFLTGAFGAGKGTHGEPIVKKMMPDYTLVNPDEVKQEMPEDEGWNATHTHEESSHISKEIAKKARELRHNVLYDGSGQNSDKMNKLATELKKQGYDVHVVHLSVPLETSAYRAAKRFLDNPFGSRDPNKKPTRYAPLQYVVDDVDSLPDKTFDTLKNNPAVTSGVSFDTSTGQPIKGHSWDRSAPPAKGSYHELVSNKKKELVSNKAPEQEDPKASANIKKAVATSHKLASTWQKKLDNLGVKVVMGGSLVSGLALPSSVHDMDVRFLFNGDRQSIIPEIEKATGLKFRKTIKVGGGDLGPESDAYMIEGKLNVGGINLDVEGQLRDTNYVGWAKYYPEVMTPEELKNARQKKMELRGDKKAYKAFKNGLLAEVQKRVRERGLLERDKGAEAPTPANPAEETAKPAPGSYHEQITNANATAMPRGLKGTVLGHLNRAGAHGMSIDALRSALGANGEHADAAIEQLGADKRLERHGDRVYFPGAKEAAARDAAKRQQAKAQSGHEMSMTPSAFPGDEVAPAPAKSYADQIAEKRKKLQESGGVFGEATDFKGQAADTAADINAAHADKQGLAAPAPAKSYADQVAEARRMATRTQASNAFVKKDPAYQAAVKAYSTAAPAEKEARRKEMMAALDRATEAYHKQNPVPPDEAKAKADAMVAAGKAEAKRPKKPVHIEHAGEHGGPAEMPLGGKKGIGKIPPAPASGWAANPELQKKVYGKVVVKPEPGQTMKPYAQQIAEKLRSGKKFPSVPHTAEKPPPLAKPNNPLEQKIREAADKQLAANTKEAKEKAAAEAAARAADAGKPYAPLNTPGEHARTWQAMAAAGFRPNTYRIRTADGETVAPKQGWIKKNPETGKWEGFTGEGAVAALNAARTQGPPSPAAPQQSYHEQTKARRSAYVPVSQRGQKINHEEELAKEVAKAKKMNDEMSDRLFQNFGGYEKQIRDAAAAKPMPAPSVASKTKPKNSKAEPELLDALDDINEMNKAPAAAPQSYHDQIKAKNSNPEPDLLDAMEDTTHEMSKEPQAAPQSYHDQIKASKASSQVAPPKMLDAIKEAEQRGPVTTWGLREKLGMSKQEFDKAINTLVDKGQIVMHQHDEPDLLSAEQRADTIPNPNNPGNPYFMIGSRD